MTVIADYYFLVEEEKNNQNVLSFVITPCGIY